MDATVMTPTDDPRLGVAKCRVPQQIQDQQRLAHHLPGQHGDNPQANTADTDVSAKRGVGYCLGDLTVGYTDGDLDGVILRAVEHRLGMAVIEEALLACMTADATAAGATKGRAEHVDARSTRYDGTLERLNVRLVPGRGYQVGRQRALTAGNVVVGFLDRGADARSTRVARSGSRSSSP